MAGKPKRYGCPHCRSTEDFAEANVLRATALVLSFNEKGEPIYVGESELDWDSQTLDRAAARPYRCEACGKSFANAVPVVRRFLKRAA